MKILIISKFTWPHQSPRAFRTAELSEELARLGHDVTVFSVSESADYAAYKHKTQVEVRPIVMRFPTNKGGVEYRNNVLDKAMYHCLNKLTDYPSIEFKWRVTELLKKEKDIDLLITIAVPHEIHFGAAVARKKSPSTFPKCWIADCGDPFMFNPYMKPFFWFAREEKRWCRLCDYITVPTEQSVNGYYPEFRKKINVIPQGFDFDNSKIAEYQPNKIPTFAYAGRFYPGLRDPYQFLDYLLTLNTDFCCIFFIASDLPQKYKDTLGEKLIVNKNWKRKDIIYELSKMDFLINIPNKGTTVQVPSKLIDYALAKRPVLSVETDFAQQQQFHDFLQGNYTQQMVLPDLSKYDIKNVAQQFLSLASTKLKK